MEKLNFITNCVSAEGDDINNMVDSSIEVSYETFIKHVDYKELNNMFSFPTLLVKNDWHVTWNRGTYKNKRVYFVVHSCIEWIFG